jgi:hypothetical protein
LKRRKATRKRAKRRRARITVERRVEAGRPSPSVPRPVRRRAAVLLFLACLLVYNANLRLIGSGDSLPARLLPFAILNHGTIYLDVFGPRPDNAYWFSWSRKGRLVSFYPVVLPVLVTPLFVPAAIYLEGVETPAWRFRIVGEMMEKLSASIIASLSVVVVWLVLRRIASPAVALLLALAYAFGTQTWTTSSQALWQHGLGELLLASALLLLVRPATSRIAIGLLGAIAALLAFNRPPDALFSLAIAAYLFLDRRREITPFAIGGALAAAPFLVYNLAMFGRPLGGYQLLLGSDSFRYNVPEGIAALLVSPGKGLIVFAPFLLFLLKSPLAAFGPERRMLAIVLWGAFLAQLLFYGTIDWTGGACYGPRFLTDPLPFLIVSLAPAVAGLKKPVTKLAFGIALAFAVWVQAVGAFCFPAGGSYLLTRRQLWSPSGAQFLLEARAGLASPEFVFRARDWLEKHRGTR